MGVTSPEQTVVVAARHHRRERVSMGFATIFQGASHSRGSCKLLNLATTVVESKTINCRWTP